MKALVIAGTASGVGKTTVAIGLMAALARRGLRIQPFKVGPDYIDPSYHAIAAGRPSRNLDSWMVEAGPLRELFGRAAEASDVAIVEGVMGLHDGRSGGGEVGSTAHVAKLIGAPVVLVIDAARTARSAAAIALGYRQLDPQVDLAGVILNNVATPGHYAATAEPIERETGLAVLGSLRRDAAWRLRERYLGLVPAPEQPLDGEVLDRLATAVAEGIELNRLLEVAERVRPRATAASSLIPAKWRPARARVAIARDAAFSFYYEDNLELLTAWGAELVTFSPRRDERLPRDTAGVYVGGGFPELFAQELADNAPLLADLQWAARAGMPMYGECGGLMYLAEGLVDQEGRRHAMAGILPGWSSLERGRLTLGYREVQARLDSPLLREGERVRGHELHWSTTPDPPGEARAAYDVVGSDRREGYVVGSVLASYVHLHFATKPELAPRFVDACRGWREQSLTGGATRAHSMPLEARTESPHAVIPNVAEDFGPNPAPPTPPGRDPTPGPSPSLEPTHGRADAGPHPLAPSPPRGGEELPRRVPPPRGGEGPGVESGVGERGGIGGPPGAADGPLEAGSLLRRYGLPPAEIEALSMRRILEHHGERLPTDEPARSFVARLVYAVGDPALAAQVSLSDGAIWAAVTALAAGATVVVDVAMVAAGVDREALARCGGELLIAIDTARGPGAPGGNRITRAASGILALGDRLEGAVVAVGNAPTALLAVLDMVRAGAARPAAVLGFPVGFVAATESKEHLAEATIPWMTIRGTRGGSPVATAALNHLLRLASGRVATGLGRNGARSGVPTDG